MSSFFLILHSVAILMFATTWGYPLIESTSEIADDVLVKKQGNLNHTTIDCRKPNEFSFHPNGTAFVLNTNQILKRSEYINFGDNVCIIKNIKNLSAETRESLLLNLTKLYYKPDDYGFLYDDTFTFENKFIQNDVDGIFMSTTESQVDDYDYENMITKEDSTRDAFIHIGQVGASISILSLFLHLLVFALRPAKKRDIQSYSLASLSIAFIVGYFFFLFGKIPNVTHVFCVVTASFRYFSFLSAYVWMGVIIYDLWRCLKLAIHHNLAPSSDDRKCRFVCYSICGWGIPFVLMIATLTDGFSSEDDAYKPFFGRYNICWFTNTRAKNIYFGIPFLVMLVYGIKLLIRGVVMMVRNTIDPASDPQRTALRNLALYARLAVIMAITWSIGFAAILSEQKQIWVIFDAFNSFQGFFIFMFYSSKSVWHFCKNRSKSTSTDTAALFIIENSTSSSAVESDSIQ